MKSINELQDLFNHELAAQSFSGEPEELYKPFGYMMSLGGKRIRPVMLLHACEMFGTDASQAMQQALAIELFHNFTLIHDDIMDNAPLRRGLPSVHEKFGNTVAILSGDAMLVTAYKYLLHTNPQKLPTLLNLFNEAAIKVCEGQQLDMNFERLQELKVSDYLNMIELKTASLIAASLKMGAIVGGASAEDAEHLYNFGKQLGISFQLKDDWLDSFGSTEKTGKQPGGDILQNKKTFLLIEAMNSADEKVKQELQDWYSVAHFNPAEKIDAVLKLFEKIGISELAQKETAKHYQQALSYLDQVSVHETNKSSLRKLSENLLHRDK
ncbi:MAG: polyprenyl synthetase family protein [Chitinophagaceae bacterium]|nr:polyprenyl synthetase family protein [Chitinophagaceae bacterium]